MDIAVFLPQPHGLTQMYFTPWFSPKVFIIGHDKKLKLSILYPATTGRNFEWVKNWSHICDSCSGQRSMLILILTLNPNPNAIPILPWINPPPPPKKKIIIKKKKKITMMTHTLTFCRGRCYCRSNCRRSKCYVIENLFIFSLDARSSLWDPDVLFIFVRNGTERVMILICHLHQMCEILGERY